mmetsp:Transcript_182833/g.445128  ORF Transcript_182833/g.445128 Transcript_182833/m.445128 type:complete len:94 (-) Transcript_182833:498-779(-)
MYFSHCQAGPSMDVLGRLAARRLRHLQHRQPGARVPARHLPMQHILAKPLRPAAAQRKAKMLKTALKQEKKFQQYLKQWNLGLNSPRPYPMTR